MTLPWWFWFFPGLIFVGIAGVPLWGWLLKRSGDPHRHGESSASSPPESDDA